MLLTKIKNFFEEKFTKKKLLNNNEKFITEKPMYVNSVVLSLKKKRKIDYGK